MTGEPGTRGYAAQGEEVRHGDYSGPWHPIAMDWTGTLHLRGTLDRFDLAARYADTLAHGYVGLNVVRRSAGKSVGQYTALILANVWYDLRGDEAVAHAIDWPEGMSYAEVSQRAITAAHATLL